MLIVLLYFQNLEQAYKDYSTSYMSFALSSSLEVNLSKTKIMIFGRNKWKLNQEVLNLNKDLIEITHEYKYLGIDSY